jgi:acetoin:2,6-dichlorophenolindophenol oxidoreductase subunit beta
MIEQFTCAEAIRQALLEEMQRNARCVVIGQGLKDTGIWGTVPLICPDRLIESPLSEAAQTGFAIGLAQAGWKPVCVDIRFDFALFRANQIINEGAKGEMWGKAFPCGVVFREVIGRSWGQGGTHSQAFQSFFAHVPGVKVFAPVSAEDHYFLMKEALSSDDPVIFVEHRLLHKNEGPIDLDGGPDKRADGTSRNILDNDRFPHICVVGVSHAQHEARKALMMLGDSVKWVSVPLTRLAPLDLDEVKYHASRCRRVLIVDNSWLPCSISSEVAAQLAECVPGLMIKRMGFKHRSCPPHKEGERTFYPSASAIASAVWKMITTQTKAFPDAPVECLNPLEGPF